MKNNCSICQKTNQLSSNRVFIVASFAQAFHARGVQQEIEKAHIFLSWQTITVQNELPTLILELHGIKDIVHLQALFIESMCQEHNALTIDIFSTPKSCEKILQSLS